jgi:beta-lactamase regulating signal transducer with metallopeptidase domain
MGKELPMKTMMDLLAQPLAQQLGWCLVHFLWQGALLAGVYALGRALLGARSANARYLAACLTLFLMAAAPVVTFHARAPGRGETGAAFAPAQPPSLRAGSLPLATGPSQPPALDWPGARLLGEALATVEGALPWIVAAWLAGVGALSVRLLFGWAEVRRLRRRATEPLGGQLLGRLRELQARMEVSRPVRLFKSGLVKAPVVIGWFRPIILLPASVLTGLSPAQLEFVLAHELAHLRRYDYWVNLFQVAVETLLFYHPAVWWVSHCIREEREHCCDELAVAVCGNRMGYASALTALEEVRQSLVPVALAASGGSLVQRIRDVLGVAEEKAPRSRRRSLGNALAALGLLTMAASPLCLLFHPVRYQSMVRIAVEKDVTDVDPLGRTQSPMQFDPYFMQTEFERIQSKSILDPVIKDLELCTRWAKDYGELTLALQEARQLLRKNLDVRQSRNTSLIEIRVFSKRRDEAAEIANKIATTYRESRKKLKSDRAKAGIWALDEQLKIHDGKVKALQESVDDMRAKLHVEDWLADTQREGLPATREQENQRRLESERVSARAEYLQAEAMLTELKKLSPSQLKTAIYTVSQDAVLAKQLQDLSAAQQDLAKARVNYADDHPEVKKALVAVTAIEKQIEERVEGILTGLEVRAKSSLARAEQLEKELDKAKYLQERQAANISVYQQAKRELDNEQRLRDSLLLRTLQERVDAQLPRSSIVEIVDEAEPAIAAPSAEWRLAGAAFALGALLVLAGELLRISAPRLATAEKLG